MIESLEKRVKKLQDLILVSEVKYNQLVVTQKSVEQKVGVLGNEAQELQKVTELFRFVIENKSKESKEKLEHLLSFGLKTVFKDQDLRVRVEEGMERNKPTLKIKLIHNGNERPLFGSFGGGVVNIVAFLMRVLALSNSKMRPFLVLDEQFSMVSEEYIPNTAELIRKLCDKMGLDAMVITHKESFRDHANRIYHMESGSSGAIRIRKLEVLA